MVGRSVFCARYPEWVLLYVGELCWLRELMREPVAIFRVQLVQPNRARPEGTTGTRAGDYAGMTGMHTIRMASITERDSAPMLANPARAFTKPVQK